MADSRYQPLVPVVAAVAGGILLDRYWPLPVAAWWLSAAAALAVWLALWRRRRETAGAIVLLIAAAALGTGWHHCRWSLVRDDDVGHFARQSRQPVCLEAIALGSARLVPPPPPDPLETMAAGERTRVELEVLAIRDRGKWRRASGCCELMIEGRREEIRAGDRLRVLADLRAASGAANPGGFDVAHYQRAQRRWAYLHAPHAEGVVRIDSGWVGMLPRAIDAGRRYGKDLLARWLSPQRAGLAAAVLLGAREQLDPGQYLSYLETGTVHLLVVSGLNVGILAFAMWAVMRRLALPTAVSLSVVAAVAVAYMLLTDAEPPIVRATVLVLGTGLALVLGRSIPPFNGLAAAALVVLAVNPADLFNVGAQLSFLCVLGMAWLVPRWIETEEQRELLRLIEASHGWPYRMARYFWRIVVLSFVLWALTAPLSAARFHILAPVGSLVNAVLTLPVFAAMLSGFGLLLVGWIWPLAWLLGHCCDLSLWFMQAVVDLARRVPGGHFWTFGPSDWWLAGLYGGMGVVAVWPRLRSTWRWPVGMLGAWCAVGLAVLAVPRGPALECTFLDVGHGCAVVLRLPDGRTILYDAGHLGPRWVAGRAVADYLWWSGLRRVDTIVISHADTDHYNAVPELLDRFGVREVCVSPVMFRQKSRALAALQQSLASHGIEPRSIHAGEVLARGDCVVRVLHPPSEGFLGRDNANSLVLGVEYRGKRIVLPGDLDSPGLEDLLAKPAYRSDILLAPHHGSRRSHPEALADWTGAKWIVVTGSTRVGGGDDPPGDLKGRTIFHTARSGAVTARVDGCGLTIKGCLETRPISVQEPAGSKTDGT